MNMIVWIWSGVSAVFIFFGFYAWISKEPVGFWNVQQKIEVTDIKRYNYAVAKMWFFFSMIFWCLGIPLMLTEQNSAWAVIPILGGVFLAIGLMVAYTDIEKKYCIK